VLAGDIPAASLVTMSAADLASKDVAEFRRKVEEEHNKAIELDVEAAAKVGGVATDPRSQHCGDACGNRQMGWCGGSCCMLCSWEEALASDSR
jgi:hypothetical protein